MLAPAPALLALILAAQVDRKVVEGDARFGPDGRPAAGMTIRVGIPSVAAGVEVVADAWGRFRAEVRPGGDIPQPDGNEAECEAVAEPAGRWRIEPYLTETSHKPEDQWRRDAARALACYARGTWRDGRLVVDCPEPGEVDVLVVGRDGKPLGDREVVVDPDRERFRSSTWGLGVRFLGRTDAAGRFRIRWFEGPLQFRVTVPGEGAASTQPFSVKAGKTVAVSTLLPVRLGSISGRVAPALLQPGARLVDGVLPGSRRQWPVGADGRFELRDLLPGRHSLRLEQSRPGPSGVPQTVWLAAGQEVEGLVIEANPPPTPEQDERQKRALRRSNLAVRGPGNDGKEVTWFEGTVRDARGRGVAGATVFARTTYYGGMRSYTEVRQATSDDRGHYAIRGAEGRGDNVLLLVAHAPGRPPAAAHVPSRVRPADGAQAPPAGFAPRPSQDLTLADPGAGGTIRIPGEGGKPREVRLRPEGAGDVLFADWAREAASDPSRALEAALSPKAEVDRGGDVRFAGLMPGLYSTDPERDLGLAAVSGRETPAAPVAGPVVGTVRFRVLRPDGTPVRNQRIGLQAARGQARPGSNGTHVPLDDDGFGEHTVIGSGLWVISARFRDVPSNVFWFQDPPFDEALAQFAVAPGLAPADPIRLAATPRDRESGSLRVRLVDADGRPARGMVLFEDTVGATDAQGEVRFAGVGPEPRQVPRRVYAWAEGPAPPAWPSSGPFPPDEALRGRVGIVPGAEVEITAGRERVVTLAARPVGYIRGRLQPAEGRKVADYSVYPSHYPFDNAPNWRVDPASGEFLAGPFPPGPVTLALSAWSDEGDGTRPCGRTVVEVVAGEVARADLVPREVGPDDPEVKARASGHRVPELVPMHVVLPDGRTPAYAAQAVLFVPSAPRPVANGISDGGGRLTWRVLSGSGPDKDDPRDGRVDRPTAVVSLPGQFGATVVPLEEGVEQRVVLPPEIDVAGTVRVGGPPAPRSSVRVVAAHRGRGDLDAALGRTTTAGPDGRFTLSGLTPGRYAVQAVRDEVWTSDVVEMVVEPGRDAPTVALTVPPPGPDVTLVLQERTGRVLADTAFRLVPPPGPLADLWGRLPLRSDARGHLTLRGLTVGRHAIAIAETGDAAEFTVAPDPAGPQPIPIHRATP